MMIDNSDFSATSIGYDEDTGMLLITTPDGSRYLMTRVEAEMIAGQLLSMIETLDSWDRVAQKKINDAAGY